MSGFQSPNYTQTPNELFDVLMRDMGGAELRVVLAIVRQTIGYHRTETRYSVPKLMEITGLSRNSVKAGADAAEARGLIERVNPDTKEGAEWRLVVETKSEIDTDPQNLTVQPSEIEGQVGLKESIKEKYLAQSAESLPIDWQVAAGRTFVAMTSDHYRDEVSFLAQQYFRNNEDLIPYATTFMLLTHRAITKRDAPLWRKALRGMVEQHYTVEDFRIALVEHLDKKGKDGTPLSIKSPLSVEYALRHNQIEPQGVWVSA